MLALCPNTKERYVFINALHIPNHTYKNSMIFRSSTTFSDFISRWTVQLGMHWQQNKHDTRTSLFAKNSDERILSRITAGNPKVGTPIKLIQRLIILGLIKDPFCITVHGPLKWQTSRKEWWCCLELNPGPLAYHAWATAPMPPATTPHSFPM